MRRDSSGHDRLPAPAYGAHELPAFFSDGPPIPPLVAPLTAAAGAAPRGVVQPLLQPVATGGVGGGVGGGGGGVGGGVGGGGKVDYSSLPSFFHIKADDGSAGYGLDDDDDGEESVPLSFDNAGPHANAWKQLWGGLAPEDYRLILMDKVATFSITPMAVANVLAARLARLPGITPACTITDGTACVGGDTVAFARYFARVNAIEVSESRCKMLLNNVDVCRAAQSARGGGDAVPDVRGSVYIYHGDCLPIVPRLRQDIVYLDVPWGGKQYKAQASLKLFLSSRPLHDVAVRLCECASFVALKLPVNANVDTIERDPKLEVVDSAPLSNFRVLVVRARQRPAPEADERAARLLFTLLKSTAFVDTLKTTVKR